MMSRRQQAQQVRNNAAQVAANRPHPIHRSNGEELEYRQLISNPDDPTQKINRPSHIANFTKGLPHDPKTGLLLDSRDYQNFVKAIDSGDPKDFSDLSLGPGPFDPNDFYQNFNAAGQPIHDWQSSSNKNNNTKVRAWESQGAGNTFDLEGPDAQAVTMPPAPKLDSQELISEIAEVYWMAILRDVPFLNYTPGATVDSKIETARKSLAQFNWFNGNNQDLTSEDLSPESQNRRRLIVDRNDNKIQLNKLFRGVTKGDDVGPYISQFLLIGNASLGKANCKFGLEEGRIAYGAITVEQKVRVAQKQDFMTTWPEWIDVQNGADVRGNEKYECEKNRPQYRFITTPRDLTTYVHFDALYEAYLNACLILLGMKAPFDPGIPFQDEDFRDKQQAFAQFGGPHILSLVTEVATRALKAVRFQKFNVHRRLRPEAIGGLLYQWENCQLAEVAAIEKLYNEFKGKSGIANQLNADKNNLNGWLLPMAFPEGSPMHPAYGAGHATVAGACVTILKAFFDHGWELRQSDGTAIAYESNSNGTALNPVVCNQPLTVEGELNKLASNISIGRNWAGVHYFTDYIESIRLGEKIALGILEEQKLTYGENFSMTVPLFDGGTVRI